MSYSISLYISLCVSAAMNITATFKEMFELDEFPLDYQALNVWLISEWPFDQLELVKDDEYMDRLTTSTFTGNSLS